MWTFPQPYPTFSVFLVLTYAIYSVYNHKQNQDSSKLIKKKGINYEKHHLF